MKRALAVLGSATLLCLATLTLDSGSTRVARPERGSAGLDPVHAARSMMAGLNPASPSAALQEKKNNQKRRTLDRLASRNAMAAAPTPFQWTGGVPTALSGSTRMSLTQGRTLLELPDGARAELSLASIRSAGELLYQGASVEYGALSEMEVSAARGPVTERFKVVANGLEQLFDIAQPVTTGADLEFHVAVDSNLRAPENGTTDVQVTFWNGQQVAFTYGKVVTIDANGASIASPVTYQGGEVCFNIPGAWLQTAAYPVVVDPLIGTMIVIGNSPNAIVYHPNDLAHNPTADNYLAVWNDIPAGLDGNILGAIVDPVAGTVGATINIETTALDLAMPSVAWNAAANGGLGAYLIVMSNEPIANQFKVSGLIVSATGAPIGGATPFDISAVGTATSIHYEPRVASNGTNWQVVWTNDDVTLGTGNVLTRMVNGTSTNAAPSFGTAATNVAVTANDEREPAIAFLAGNSYLCVFEDLTVNTGTGGIFGKTITTAGVVGAVLNQYDAATAGFNREEPSVCANTTASEFLVGWDRWENLTTGLGDPVVRRASTAGAGLGTEVIVDAGAGTDAQHVTLAYNIAMNQYFVSWWDDSASGFTLYDVQAAQLAGATAAVVLTDVAIAPAQNLNGNFFGLPLTCSTNRAGSSHVITGWRHVGNPAAAPFTFDCQRYDMNNPPAAPVAANMIQKQGAAATAPTDPEGFVYTALPRQESFSGGVATDPEGQTVRVQIERILNAAAFTGTFTEQSALVASGGTPTITVGGIANGQYKWRARFVDSFGTASAWVDFATVATPDHEFNVPNQAPPAPAIVQSGTTQGQFRMNGTTAIALGGITPEGTVLLKGVIAADPDGDNVRLEVEVVPAGSGFTGVATATSVFGAAGNHQASFAPVVSAAGYRWQAWTRDSSGSPTNPISGTVDFGANGTASDFARDVAGNTTNAPTVPLQFEAGGITPLAVGATAASRTVVLRATVSDAQADTVAIQVEVKDIGIAFDGTITATGNFVTTGGDSNATFTLGGFAAGSFHWQVRTIDSLGATSAFITFGGNSDVVPAAIDFTIPLSDPGGSRNNVKCSLGAGLAGSWFMLAVALLGLLALRRR